MKVVKKIEMADDANLYDVKFDGTVSIIKDGIYYIVEDNNGDELSRSTTLITAENDILDCAVDPMLVITGYGIYSGRKFWQLPDDIQHQVYKLSRGVK